MEKFWDKISVTTSEVIWYILPGIIIFFVFLLPIIILYSSSFFEILSKIGVIPFFVCGIILSFILEGLRLYRFRPGYKKIKQKFFNDLKEAVGQSIDAYYILDHVYELASEKHYDTIRLYHSIWIMLGHVSVCTFILSITELPFFFILYRETNNIYSILNVQVSGKYYDLFCASLIIIYLIISIRIMYISIEEQKKCNRMYLEFLKSNYIKIRGRVLNGKR